MRLDGDIDQQTYDEQSARLSREIYDAEQELRQAESNFLDLEGVLVFAEKIITSPARLWLESTLDQRQRLQGTFFPDRLEFDGEKFGTTATSLFFSLLEGCCDSESHMASPTGFEPVLSP